jgi:DNA-3-methyladenine glycosylase I
MNKVRCTWAETTELMKDYHDNLWGVPSHDNNYLFEMLNLEGAQAGLSWSTILARKQNYEKAFDNFDPIKMSQYSQAKQAELKEDKSIIRNQLKIQAFVENAKAYLKLEENNISFSDYIWSFTSNKVLLHNQQTEAEAISIKMSKDMKAIGFKFFGPTICFAYMQSTGMINDHTPNCFKYKPA